MDIELQLSISLINFLDENNFENMNNAYKYIQSLKDENEKIGRAHV